MDDRSIVKITISDDLGALRAGLARIPDISTAEARRAVRRLRAEIDRANRRAKRQEGR